MKKEPITIRNKTGLSRRAFREIFGIPERTLQAWEEGEHLPPDYVLRLLEISVNDYCYSKFFDTEEHPSKITIKNLLSVIVLDDISEIIITKDICETNKFHSFHFYIPKYSEIVFSKEIQLPLMPMIVAKAKLVSTNHCALVLEVSMDDLNTLFCLTKGFSFSQEGAIPHPKQKSEKFINLYKLNELIYDYEQEYPEATVYQISKESGIVLFDRDNVLEMYNADTQLLGMWSGDGKYEKAEKAFITVTKNS